MMTAAAVAAKGSRLVDELPDMGMAVGGGVVADAIDVGAGVWMLYDPAELGLYGVTLKYCFGDGSSEFPLLVDACGPAGR
jgi:hypothetical protein